MSIFYLIFFWGKKKKKILDNEKYVEYWIWDRCVCDLWYSVYKVSTFTTSIFNIHVHKFKKKN